MTWCYSYYACSFAVALSFEISRDLRLYANDTVEFESNFNLQVSLD